MKKNNTIDLNVLWKDILEIEVDNENSAVLFREKTKFFLNEWQNQIASSSKNSTSKFESFYFSVSDEEFSEKWFYSLGLSLFFIEGQKIKPKNKKEKIVFFNDYKSVILAWGDIPSAYYHYVYENDFNSVFSDFKKLWNPSALKNDLLASMLKNKSVESCFFDFVDGLSSVDGDFKKFSSMSLPYYSSQKPFINSTEIKEAWDNFPESLWVAFDKQREFFDLKIPLLKNLAEKMNLKKIHLHDENKSKFEFQENKKPLRF